MNYYFANEIDSSLFKYIICFINIFLSNSFAMIFNKLGFWTKVASPGQ